MDAITDKLEATQQFVTEQIRTLRAELRNFMEHVGQMEERISSNLRSTIKRKFSDRIEHMRSEMEDRMNSIAEKIMRRAPTDYDDDEDNDDRADIASPVAEPAVLPGSDPVVPPSVDPVDTPVASTSAAPVASPVTAPTSARRVIDLEEDGDDRDERQTEFVIARKRSDDDDDSDEIPQSQFDNSDLQPYRHHQHALDALNQDQAALVLFHVESTMSGEVPTNDVVRAIMQDALRRRLWSQNFKPPGIKNTLQDYLRERVKNTRRKIRKQAEISRLNANLKG